MTDNVRPIRGRRAAPGDLVDDGVRAKYFRAGDQAEVFGQAAEWLTAMRGGVSVLDVGFSWLPDDSGSAFLAVYFYPEAADPVGSEK